MVGGCTFHLGREKEEAERETQGGGERKKVPGVSGRWGRKEIKGSGGKGSGGPGCWQGCRNPREWPVPYYPDSPLTYTHIFRERPHDSSILTCTAQLTVQNPLRRQEILLINFVLDSFHAPNTVTYVKS